MWIRKSLYKVPPHCAMCKQQNQILREENLIFRDIAVGSLPKKQTKKRGFFLQTLYNVSFLIASDIQIKLIRQVVPLSQYGQFVELFALPRVENNSHCFVFFTIGYPNGSLSMMILFCREAICRKNCWTNMQIFSVIFRYLGRCDSLAASLVFN